MKQTLVEAGIDSEKGFGEAGEFHFEKQLR
jgi:hypothetical protein